tara:strand:- start:30616 stop:31545 length:930 start_codon:yes stop_codon:yes gene_type:complete
VASSNRAPLRDKAGNISCRYYEASFDRYITTHELLELCKENLIPQLYGVDLIGVAGIPRSGMLVASMVALLLRLPLYYIDEEQGPLILNSASTFGGRRMAHFKEGQGKILIVDDWVWKGNEMRRIKNILKSFPPNFLFAGIFVDKSSTDLVDFSVHVVDKQVPYCEWSIFEKHIPGVILDLDGLLCKDAPYQILDDEDKYREFISEVPPIMHQIPRNGSCHTVLTGRSNKYRKETEVWLMENGVNYRNLVMYPEDIDIPKNYDFSSWKAEYFLESNAILLIESNCIQAQLIFNKSGKPTLCLPKGRMFK